MNRTYNKDVFVIYDGACKSGEYFNPSKLLKIEGEQIESIWCPCDFTKDPKVVDACGWSYHTYYNRYKFNEINRFGFLPEELKPLFGWQNINGRNKFVRHVSFRTESSGHASWDSIMSIYCDDTTFSVWYDRKGTREGITQNHPYVKRWLSLFGKNIKNPHPKEYYWEFEKAYPKLDKYSGTRIQYVDGEFFPDVHCKPWRKWDTHAYKLLDKNRLIILNEDENKVYRLTKAVDLSEGESNLILINPMSFDEYYVFPAQYNKVGLTGFVRYSIDKIGSKYLQIKNSSSSKPIEENLHYLNYFWRIYSIKSL